MKIFKWLIYPKGRIDSICKLMEGSVEDRNVAKALLRGTYKWSREYPRFEIEVKETSVILWRQDHSHLVAYVSTNWSYTNDSEKDYAIKNLKDVAAKSKLFKSYKIKL